MTAASVIAALCLPADARVDQRVPKKLLVENGAPTAADKRQINDGIEELLWLAALKPATIGVPVFRDDTREYLEIAVLSLTLRPGAKATRLSELIHRAIPYPVFLIQTQPVSGNGPSVDNPPVLSPAGRVHCTIQDWARYIADQLRGARGEPALLQPASYKKLHTPPFGGEYALGWLVVDRKWSGGPALNHSGDNTMNFANVWVAPRRDLAMLVCVNQSGRTAFEASDEAVGALMDLHTAGDNRVEPAGPKKD